MRPFVLAATICAAAPPALALDAERAPTQYALTQWGPSSLGSDTVNAVLQSQDGYLWLGTGAGLLRHDGVRFEPIDSAAAPTIGDGVASLAEGADGSLYVGTMAGHVVHHANGVFTRLRLRDGTGPVHALHVARDGALWIAQLGRPVARWRPGADAHYYLSDIATVTTLALAEDDAGVLRAGSADGLMHLDGSAFRRDAATSDAVQALCPAPDGVLWIGTRHGLLRSAAGTVRRFTTADGLPHDSVSALALDRDGNLWAGTAGGLVRWTPRAPARLTLVHGLPDDDVRALHEDRDGHLWVGTAGGLARLANGRFVTYGRLEGLRDPAIFAAIPAKDGGAWLGTGSAEVVRLKPDGSRVTRRLPVGGQGLEAVQTLFEASDGALWVSVANGRVFRLAGGTVGDHTPVLDAQQRQSVSGFFEDAAGLGVLVTRMGLGRLDGARGVTPVHTGGDALTYLHATHRDRGGTLWIACSAGLGRYGPEGYRLYTTDDGLPHRRVRWISEDEGGTLWLATGGGLVRFQAGRFAPLGVEHGLLESYLRVVLDDGLGYLWMAGHTRLFRVAKNEIADVLEKRAARVSPLVFDTSDGLRTTAARLGNSPGFRAADGRLWFTTSKGVSVVDPRQVAADRPAPPVAIESIAVDGKRGDPRAPGEYGPGRGEVTIDYTAVHFVAPHRVRFRHRLHGLDAAWVDAGARRYAYYGALPAGRYRFEVMASNSDGIWNGAPASLGFVIHPPFVKTPLFYLLAFAAVGIAAAAAHRLRVRQMRARFAAVLAERTRIAREMHDTLAQGVTGIGLQIEAALKGLGRDTESTRDALHRAHAMARSSLDEVRRSIWVLRAQTSAAGDDLAATLAQSLGQLGEAGGPRTVLQVAGEPRRLPVAVERNVLRIAHEAVTNALRHSGASAVTATLDFAADGLRLEVRDDGCGFDVDGHQAGSGVHHFGLLGITERARVLGGELTVASRPGEGTSVSCRIPYGARADTEEVSP